MKKTILTICLACTLLLAACSQTIAQDSSVQPSVSAVQPSPSVQASVPASASASTVTQTAAASAQTSAVASASAQPTEPSNEAEMYSSYAHMVSFDPKTGWAQFDYFDMLKGNDAVQWLVENKGYTKASAQAEVSGYADSEFIEKNTNTQLRTVDLKSVPLRMMYKADGTQVDVPDPVAATIDDLRVLYAKDSSLVLKSFFYYIKVENGKVVSVDQVYWP
ncbi:MAG: hypothetical protein WCP73_04195 [Eubacteriales bacterium]